MRRALVLSVLVAIAAALPLAAQTAPSRLSMGEERDVWSAGQRSQWNPSGADVDGHDLILWSDSLDPATPDQLLGSTPAGTIDTISGSTPVASDFQSAAAALPDSVLAAWSESQRLMGRLYSRTGEPRTVRIADGVCRIWPHSVAANGERFVVVAGTQCDGASNALELLAIGADGTAQNVVDLVDTVAPAQAAIARWGDGFLVAWTTSVAICGSEGCGPDRTAVRALRLNRYGMPLDPSPIELQNEEASAGPPAIAISGNNALVFWSDAMTNSLRVSRLRMIGDGVDEQVIARDAVVGTVAAVGTKKDVIVVWERDDAPARSLMLTRLAVDDFEIAPVGFTYLVATADCTDQAPCAFQPLIIPHASSRATLVYRQNRENVFQPRIAARGLWFARRIHSAAP